jgi:hypothetical protein
LLEQSLDVLESRVTGIAKSKWNMYGHFFVEVLARAAAHYKAQQSGQISMDEELFIEHHTLPGWNSTAGEAPPAAAAAGGGGGGSSMRPTAAVATAGGASSDEDWDQDDGQDQQQPGHWQQQQQQQRQVGGAARLYQQFAYQGQGGKPS